MNSTVTQVFLPEARRLALAALAYMERGINAYAAKPAAKLEWISERRKNLSSLVGYIRQLEDTVRLQNEELSRRYNEGFAAGLRRGEAEKNIDPVVPVHYDQHTHLGTALRSWLNEVKTKRA